MEKENPIPSELSPITTSPNLMETSQSVEEEITTTSAIHSQNVGELSPEVVANRLTPSPLTIPGVSGVEPNVSQPKEKSKSKKDRDEKDGHSSKPHKDKKKKKKKHKHKNKHKHKEKDKDKHHSHDRTGSSGGSTNPSPVKHV